MHCDVRRHGVIAGVEGTGRSRAFRLAALVFVLTAERALAAEPLDWMAWQTPEVLTNVGQFRALPIEDYLRSCRFSVRGAVTLVDTNRQLLVLQDTTGALAVDLTGRQGSFKPGQLVLVEGTNCSPYVASFPSYPYRPSGWDLRGSFEAPVNWGDYHLTRMRGFLHPPATGEYTFWIASDNSSELWLSSDADPGKERRIAFVRQWVDPHEWLREPGQRSETIFLREGQTYYIEAFQEQLTEDDHLSVAWQGPGVGQSVVEGRYLTPWIETADQARLDRTNGILREYWTNYFAGNLSAICGPKPFDAAISAEQLSLTVIGEGRLPEPAQVPLGQALSPEDKYRWVEAEGAVAFAGHSGPNGILEVTDGQGECQVVLSSWKGDWPTNCQNWLVRVRGVCEGVRNQNGVLTAGLIWVSTEGGLSFFEAPPTNRDSLPKEAINPLAPATAGQSLAGFYITFGLVTFNDRVFGRDCLYVQDADGAIFISQQERPWGKQLQVGQWVQVGGALLPGKYIPGLRPLTLSPLEWRSLPDPLDTSVSGKKDGRWTEVRGVVRSVNPDGTLKLAASDGAVTVWIGHAPTNPPNRYVDATLRARGVMSLTLPESPVLLVPSRNFVQVEEPPPANPFAILSRPIAGLEARDTDTRWVHRVKITGVVTYKGDRLVFVQDGTGGARVQTLEDPPVAIGNLVEAVGFPAADSGVPSLTEAVLCPTGGGVPLLPDRSDWSTAIAGGLGGRLIQVKASVLGQKTSGPYQVLELQEGQRLFDALLATNLGSLPPLEPGSRVEVAGVCDTGALPAPFEGKAGLPGLGAGQPHLWLRGPRDVAVLQGPPWWTWKRVATLIGALLTVLLVAVLWIHFLRRRLERQQAARLSFSRQILQSQESERRRIAANLHDSLGQNLLVIKNQARLALQPAKDEPALRESLDQISGMASQAIEEIRQITHGLRPYQLDRLGLTQAIRAAINRVSENGPVQLASDVEDIDGVLDKESEIHVYRIVQESVNNIMKHSGATEATVVIRRRPGRISLSIRDNGRGFDAGLWSSNTRATGFGLSSIGERARILGGHLTVDSRPGAGAGLRIEIPVQEG